MRMLRSPVDASFFNNLYENDRALELGPLRGQGQNDDRHIEMIGPGGGIRTLTGLLPTDFETNRRQLTCFHGPTFTGLAAVKVTLRPVWSRDKRSSSQRHPGLTSISTGTSSYRFSLAEILISPDSYRRSF